MSTQRHIRDSIQEVDSHSWIIGDRMLLVRQPLPSANHPSWSDGSGSFYNVSEAPTPLPPSRPLPTDSPFTKVYDAGDAHAAWTMGDGFVKAVIVENPKCTREHITLAFVHSRPPQNITVPAVYHHAEYDGRYYLFTSKVPGMILNNVWPSLDDETKRYCGAQIVQMCKDLAEIKGECIGGVDGEWIAEEGFTRGQIPMSLRRRRDKPRPDFSHQTLLATCKEIGMNCSSLNFQHCDLGPTNVLIDVVEKKVGVVDWESAGFFPKEWILKKFRTTYSFQLDCDSKEINPLEWVILAIKILRGEGFPDITEQYLALMEIKDKRENENLRKECRF